MQNLFSKFIVLLAVFHFCIATSAYAQVFKYKDGEGNVRYVDDIEKIPEQYRDSVQNAENLPEVGGRAANSAEEEFEKYMNEVAKDNPLPSDVDGIAPQSSMSDEEAMQAEMMYAIINKLSTGPWPFVILVIVLVYIISGWILLSKADLPGFGILIPIYNGVVLSRLGGFSGWWMLWILVPVIGAPLWSVTVNFGTAKRFGQSTGFAIATALLPFIFLPILAFGDAQPEW